MNNKNETPNRFDEAVKIIADADTEAPAGFTQKVMAHLEDQEEPATFSWRYIMENINRKIVSISATAGVCMVALLCIVIARQETTKFFSDTLQEQPVNTPVTNTSQPEKSINFSDDRIGSVLSGVKKLIERDEARPTAPQVKIQRETSSKGATLSQLERSRQGELTVQDLSGAPAASKPQEQRKQRLFNSGPIGLGRDVDSYRSTNVLPAPRHYAPYGGAERYNELIENGTVLVSAQPVSTFSIDVDTGSYTNARRFLKSGALPPKDAVRIEEFINYFSYDYPSQSNAPFGLTYEIAPNPLDSGKYLLRLGIKAREVQDDRKPWNLVFLVDVSGSMNTQNKLPLLKESLSYLTKNLKSSDRISLVTYAGSSRIVLESTPASEKEKILQAIQNLTAGGGTNGESGIQMAYAEAKKGYIDNGVNRVILATDGDFNVGVTGNDQLIKIIEEKRKEHITLTTIGFGTGNYNEAMMEQVANKGNGNYFYIDNFREARKVFGKDLAGTIEVVAKDVKLQIEFNPEHVAQYRLIGYENRKLENHEFNDDKIDAGEIGSGHTVTALYEVVLTGSEEAKKLAIEHRYDGNKKAETAQKASGSSEFAFLKIRYKKPDGDKSKLLEFPLERSDVKSAGEESGDFKFVAAVSGFAHKLRKSTYAPEAPVEKLIQLAKSGRGTDSDGNRSEFIHLMENVSQRLK